MIPSPQQQNVNPLASLMRQPKIYIKLPSNGKYWPQGTINITDTGEYPVYSMTAKDELLLKTPDALMNGQAVVDVIQSCMPNIINAWDMPNIDTDAILIAIRLATYGENMDTTFKIGEEEMIYSVDLRTILDSLYENASWDEKIDLDLDMAIYVRPVNYRVASKTSIRSFETQKIISLVNDSTLSEEEKIQQFKDSFKKLTDITVGIVINSVYKIESKVGSTDNPEFLQEFMNNCDKKVFDAIKERLDLLQKKNSLKPARVKSTPEMIAAGAAEEIEIPITFDPSSFFG
jgi:hypothetical protein